MRLAFSILTLVTLVGCAAKGTGDFAVPEGRYEAAFEASREVLHRYRFEVERVDAAGGVITTRDKSSAGAFAPWDGDQTTPAQEVSDLLNQQRRRVRVTFDRPDGGGHVHVTVYRVQQAGVRLNSKSAQLATTATDPALTARGVWAGYDVPVTRDAELEARIARDIEKRTAKQP